jgi:hypothetical protein
MICHSRKASQSTLGPTVVIRQWESELKQSLIECWSFTKRVTQMSTAVDTFTFNSLFNAWVNRCDQSQQKGKPEQSWTNSRDPSVGKQAKAILDGIMEFHEAGDPDDNHPGYFHYQLYI